MKQRLCILVLLKLESTVEVYMRSFFEIVYNFNVWLYFNLFVKYCSVKLAFLDLYIKLLDFQQERRLRRLALLEKELEMHKKVYGK